jgi:hypothetical protein
LALLRTAGKTLKLFDNVTSVNINAADSQTGKTADLECVSKDGHVVLAVEVKDRELTLRSVQEKLPKSRERGIRELLFLVQGGVTKKDAEEVDAAIEREGGLKSQMQFNKWHEIRGSEIQCGVALRAR